jgi:hypothetical protein
MEDGSSVESGTIGREGTSGIPVLMGAGQTTMPTFVQIPGDAICVRSEVLKESYERGEEVRRVLDRYVHTVVVVGSQSAAYNARHRVEARMCCWVLMSSDGVGSDVVQLTQEYLSVMLGVRRPDVTATAGTPRRRAHQLQAWEHSHP